jgi:hypothetical protein
VNIHPILIGTWLGHVSISDTDPPATYPSRKEI